MGILDDFLKAQGRYNAQKNYINSGESRPVSNDFYELARLREEMDRAYANFYLSDENFIPEDNNSDF